MRPWRLAAPELRSRVVTRVLLTAWLVVVWLALWGDVSTANVVSGLVVAAGIQLLVRRTYRPGQVAFRPLAALRFLAYFLVKLIEAGVVIAVEVITPRDRTNKAIVAVPLRGASDTLVTVVADAVTLTPGTLTVEVGRDPSTLYVHVLHLRDVDTVRRDIRHLEVLAVRAFGTAEALEGLVDDDTVVADRSPPGPAPPDAG